MENYSPIYNFNGSVRAANAPTHNDDLVRKQDASGLSFISSIDSGSSSYLSVSAGGALSVSNLLVTDVTVDTSESSLANYVTNQAGSANHGVGDIVILTNPSPSEMYIVKSDDGTNTSHYEEIVSSLTAGEIASLLTGGTAIQVTAGGTINFNGDTDDVSEGSSNLYFTDARARAAFSAGTGIGISNGVISTSITQYTDALARNAVGAESGGGLNYTSENGEFSVDNDYFRFEVTNQSLTADTFATINHDLGEKYVHVSCYDSSENLIHLDVQLVDLNNLKVKSASNLTNVRIVVSI